MTVHSRTGGGVTGDSPPPPPLIKRVEALEIICLHFGILLCQIVDTINDPQSPAPVIDNAPLKDWLKRHGIPLHGEE